MANVPIPVDEMLRPITWGKLLSLPETVFLPEKMG